MRLYEFTKINELKKDSKVISTIRDLDVDSTIRHPNITDIMSDRGWTMVGSGAMGGVFIHPNYEYALKIFSKKDFCYLSFAREVMNSSNPHFPKFKGNPVKIGHFIALRLEKLTPITVEEYQSYYGLLAYVSVNDIFDNWSVRRGLSHLKTDMPDVDLKKVADNFEKENPQFVGALNITTKIAKKFTCELDMHYGNFMKRGNTWVIIDPVIG